MLSRSQLPLTATKVHHGIIARKRAQPLHKTVLANSGYEYLLSVAFTVSLLP